MTTQRITLPTSPDVRARLNVAGWTLEMVATDGDMYEQWYKGTEDVFVYHADGGLTLQCDARDGFTVAAILGISPTGYRMVPDEVAEATIPLLQAIIDYKPRFTTNDCADDERRFKEKKAYKALVAALKGGA